MDYKELYDLLVAFRKQNKLVKSKEEFGKIESHHILPRCCGGTDDPKNIVNLYAKEHFMAHYYLWKMHENNEFKYPLLNALWMMCTMSSSNQDRTYQEFILMSEEYQQARIEFAKYCSETMPNKVKGEKNGIFGKHWYYDPLTNKSHIFVEGQLPIGWILGKRYKDPEAFSKAVSRGNTKRKALLNGKRQFKVYNPTTGKQLILVEGLQIPNGFEKRGKPMSLTAKLKIHEFHKRKRLQNAPKMLELLRPQYAYYLLNGWNAFVEKYSYKSSQANFVAQCKRYLPEYKSRQGARTDLNVRWLSSERSGL